MSESLEANYARGGFGQRLTPGRAPALLLIAFVEAYLAPASPLYAGAEPARAAAVRLRQAARVVAIPIMHTNIEYQPGGRNGGILYRKLPVLQCFDRGMGPDWAAFTRGLEPAAGETVVSKQYASAFFGTTLAFTFASLGIDTVILAGLSTSGCVRASAVDCCQHGFIPLVVREAVGDRAREPHEANLFDLQAKHAQVVSLDDVLAYLAAAESVR